MNFFGFFVIFVVSLANDCLSDRTLSSEKRKMAQMNGEIILGGLFPMHEHNASRMDQPCGAIKEEKGIQRMEAMLYALDQINNDNSLLPNISLGALILDSCSNPSYALEQSMQFVRSFMGDQESASCTTNTGGPWKAGQARPITGVIGAAFSGVSIMVANILRLFKIPQISYASTSTELSDKSRFEYFSRVVPPDNFQALAMVEIAKMMDWTYVSTVAAEGEYGEKGIASFVGMAKKHGICVAVSLKISRSANQEEFDKIIDQLSAKPKARAVVLFVDEDGTRKLLSASVRKGKTGHFYWIGSDSWGAKIHPVRHQEWAAEGAITILPKRSSLKGFDKYFTNLRPPMRLSDCDNTFRNRKSGVNCRNPWFREFWSYHFRCRFPDEPNDPSKFEGQKVEECTGKEHLNKYEQEGLVPFVVDAVYAMAHALHNMLLDICGTGGVVCPAMDPLPSGVELLKYIRNVSFTSIQGDHIGDVKFNADGDRIGRYSIFQYQKVEEGFKYVWVGEFGEYPDLVFNDTNLIGFSMRQELSLDIHIMNWPNVSLEAGPPKSVCSEPCLQGHVKSFTDACCWSCVRCREDSVVVGEDQCQRCPIGYIPGHTKDLCLKLVAANLDWNSPWTFFPIVLSTVGIGITLEVVFVFIVYNRTSIIMASGRELSYVLLTGILASYAMTFVILGAPNIVNCALLRIGLGVCLCVCYSAIFTKTNRIYRIFSGCMKGNQKPAYISPKSQLVICSGLISVQLLGVTIWLFIDTPDVQVIYPSMEVAVQTCGISTVSLVLSLCYNMVLIFLCTWYAFKTRKIPENFNEAKYIGFTMYSTCIIWLAFIPIFFGTRNDYEIQISSLCMCVVLSATVTLCCLFMPKLYIVLFHPEKYARAAPGNKSSSKPTPTSGVSRLCKSLSQSKMRFAKSQDSSIDVLSESAKTPRTPLTPAGGNAVSRTFSMHSKLANSQAGDHVAVIETKIP